MWGVVVAVIVFFCFCLCACTIIEKRRRLRNIRLDQQERQNRAANNRDDAVDGQALINHVEGNSVNSSLVFGTPGDANRESVPAYEIGNNDKKEIGIGDTVNTGISASHEDENKELYGSLVIKQTLVGSSEAEAANYDDLPYVEEEKVEAPDKSES